VGNAANGGNGTSDGDSGPGALDGADDETRAARQSQG
jgi:hypothetical protein